MNAQVKISTSGKIRQLFLSIMQSVSECLVALSFAPALIIFS
jgi:hypothetical protein